MSLVETFLEHHGIKGMKWGVRKASGAVTKATAPAAPAQKPSMDFRKSRELKAKGVPHLSNKQLKTVTERQQLEQKFGQLNPGKVTKGHSKVKEILAIGGTGVLAYNIATSNAAKAAVKQGKKFMNQGKWANYTVPAVPLAKYQL